MSDASEISGESGAVYLAKNFASQYNYTSVTSTLTYGFQWDAMCRYIGDSQRITPKKNSVELTGSVEKDVSKNIYDLAGNCMEWTMEAYRTSCRLRARRFLQRSCFNQRSQLRPSELQRWLHFVQAHTLYKVTLSANSDKVC